MADDAANLPRQAPAFSCITSRTAAGFLLLDVLQETAFGEAALAVLVLHPDGDDVLAGAGGAPHAPPKYARVRFTRVSRGLSPQVPTRVGVGTPVLAPARAREASKRCAESGAPDLSSLIWISPCVVCFVNPPRHPPQWENRDEKSRRAKAQRQNRKPLRRKAGRRKSVSTLNKKSPAARQGTFTCAMSIIRNAPQSLVDSSRK